MSQLKEAVIKLVQSLPEDCTLKDIQYHLYVREKVERGIAAIDAGQVTSQADAEHEVTEWAKSFGPSPP